MRLFHLVSDDGTYQFTLGLQSEAVWDATSEPNVLLKYTHSDPSGLKNVKIELVCDKAVDGNLDAKGEDPPGSGNYGFTLTSKCACEDGCKGE